MAIGGGAVYATVQQGVWTTNTAQSSKVLDTVRTSVAPTASEYISKVTSVNRSACQNYRCHESSVAQVYFNSLDLIAINSEKYCE